MKKRYETIRQYKEKYLQIKALVDMPEHCVSKGDLGGYIEKEENLPQEGTGWISEDSVVAQNAVVWGGLISGGSVIIEDALIQDGMISGCKIKGKSVISANPILTDCTLENVEITSRSAITKTTLNNVHIDSQVSLQQVTILAKEKVELKSVSRWEKVMLTVDSAVVKHPCELSSVVVMAESFSIECNTKIKDCSFNVKKAIRIGGNKKIKNKEVTIEGTEEKPVNIKAESITINASRIHGDLHSKGYLYLTFSLIETHAKVRMSGSLSNSSVREMAQIYIPGKKVKNISHVHVDGDAVYPKAVVKGVS
ncbi:hypothetical protein JMA_38870 (plasmid) [Jeotgalibacillus malaysiensis]|uniref:Uncharacterized protein n=1 Tax=Jeotgalibacillus malaysiensis TaxID=1508404 RepID=A0A0B5ASL3_9BACL|nr:hypothetical protein [Jeotgalibacillus malaysiensis]AJD93205.1 hypothetical protein JMA_38870 [Jeotgalibacillus malaysiensis]